MRVGSASPVVSTETRAKLGCPGAGRCAESTVMGVDMVGESWDHDAHATRMQLKVSVLLALRRWVLAVLVQWQ
jgi:hypothetical protein